MSLEIKGLKNKVMGYAINAEDHAIVKKFCDDRNWRMSAFLEQAVNESMERVVKKEKKNA